MKNSKKIFAQLLLGLLLTTPGWFPLPTHAQITPSKDLPEGYSLIDGDIIMPTWFVEDILQGRSPLATYRTNLWTNGLIRFEFDANVTATNQTNMENAMLVLENVANVDFLQCSGNNCNNTGNYVHIQNSTFNNSQVGMVGGQQIINIVSWGTQFVIVHELLHCLGFYHEHVRADRNMFVTINCNNVQGGCNGTIFNDNFVVPNDASVFPRDVYDFDSVMHYGQCAFSIDCPIAACNCTNLVITVREPNQQWQTLIGQRDHLSALDQATVSFLYPFTGWRFLDCTYNGSNGSPDGSFRRPWTTLSAAFAGMPFGGTLWITGPCSPFPAGTYSNRITIRAAPNITARFGG
jgi:hypothetical protein